MRAPEKVDCARKKVRSNATLEFIANCAREPDTAALVSRFQNLIRTFGFDVSSGGSWVGVGRNRRYRFFFNDWPADWLKYYDEQGYFYRDFVVAESRRRMRPFL